MIVCDAFQSEMTAFADLVLPDTTYLERHDVMSMLDRPISEFDGPVDSVRVPVVPPKGECKPFQEVLIELAGRLKFPGVRQRRRHAQIPRLPRFHRQLRDRAGFRASAFSPAGAAKAARNSCRASPTRGSGRCTPRTTACSSIKLPPSYQYMRNWNKGYHEWAQRVAPAPLRRSDRDPALFRSAAEIPPRRAGQRAGTPAARASAQAHRDLFRSAAVLLRAAGSAGERPPQVSAERDHAAADGDVSLVGFAERLAAPDPRAQLSCS